MARISDTRPVEAPRGDLFYWQLPRRPAVGAPAHTQGATMAKGQQRSSKETKKPKVDKSPPKPVQPLSTAPITVVPDRSKKKK